MFNIVKHFWLLITIKKYIKKYKLKVKVRNYFNSIRITTNTNSLNFITLTEKSNYEKKVKEIRRSNVSAQIILLIPNVDYRKIFNEHLELLGVIDVKNSLANIASEISDYLDYFLISNRRTNIPIHVICTEGYYFVFRKLVAVLVVPKSF